MTAPALPLSPPSLGKRLLRTLIIDDEPAARRRLRAQLSNHAELQVMEEFGETATLTQYLQTHKVDLLFLDIRMPGQSGLELATQFAQAPRPILVFVTAYEEHALEAFGIQAADYLLKPVSAERLAKCIARVLLLHEAERALGQVQVPELPQPPLPLNRLVVPAGEKMIVIQAQQIDWIESAGNYAIIHVGRDTHVLRETLTELDQRLTPARFMRISRSTIVNMDRIRELRSGGGNGNHEMVLADGVRLQITRGIREVQSKLETN